MHFDFSKLAHWRYLRRKHTVPSAALLRWATPQKAWDEPTGSRHLRAASKSGRKLFFLCSISSLPNGDPHPHIRNPKKSNVTFSPAARERTHPPTKEKKEKKITHEIFQPTQRIPTRRRHAWFCAAILQRVAYSQPQLTQLLSSTSSFVGLLSRLG